MGLGDGEGVDGGRVTVGVPDGAGDNAGGGDSVSRVALGRGVAVEEHAARRMRSAAETSARRVEVGETVMFMVLPNAERPV